MRTAYVVGALGPDTDSETGVRLLGLDVFSEADPGNFRKDRKLFVFATAVAPTYGEAAAAVLRWVKEYHPWTEGAFNGRSRLPT